MCLSLDKSTGVNYVNMFEMFSAWQKEAEKLKIGEISKEEYDNQRYTYPQKEVERSQAQMDAIRAEKDKEHK